MACTGHSNTPNGVACTAYRPPIAAYSFTTPDLIGGTHNVQEYHFNQIRTALEQDLTRRGLTWASVGGDPGTKAAGSEVDGYTWRVLRNRINSVWAWTFSWTANTVMTAGEIIHEESVEELRSAVNSSRAVCACNCNYACTCNCNYCTCNCNYCTCNCNYCTCNCNYCTCNCNYCTCNCNYACTCNCNYSDDRLKKDVEYL